MAARAVTDTTTIKNYRLGWRLAAFGVVSALFFFVGLPFAAKKLIFLPTSRVDASATWDDTTAALRSLDRVQRFEEVTLHSGAERTRIVCWLVTSPVNDATVILLHGNAGNIAHRGWIADRLASLGASTLLVGYQGYGDSDGTPSEQAFVDDAQAAWEFLVRQRGVDPATIVVMGESIGGHPALSLAGSRQVGAVVLASPFSSIADVAVALAWPTALVSSFIGTRMSNVEAVRDVHCPLVVFATRSDRIVPFAQSRRVFDAAPSRDKQFVELDNCGHNDMLFLHEREWMQRFADLIAALKEKHQH